MIERLALAGLLVSAPAAAQGVVEGAVLYYADTDDVTVVSPTLSARWDDGGDLSAGARLTADVISAASVDLVTAASPGGYEETRREAEVDLGLRLGPGSSVGLGHGRSVEPDFVTDRISAHAETELADRRLSLGLSLNDSRSRFGRTGAERLEFTRAAHGGELSASAVLRPTLALDAVYGLSLHTGEQMNPYRWVRLYTPDAETHATAVAERVPDTRWRHVATLRLRARPWPTLYTLAAYRLYTDTWGVDGHTLQLRASRTFADEIVVLSLEGRGYLQSAADFYRARYETFPQAPRWRTADKELGPMGTVRGGLHVEVSPPDTPGLRLGLGGEVYHMRYLDYAWLESRTAGLYTLDLTWTP